MSHFIFVYFNLFRLVLLSMGIFLFRNFKSYVHMQVVKSSKHFHNAIINMQEKNVQLSEFMSLIFDVFFSYVLEIQCHCYGSVIFAIAITSWKTRRKMHAFFLVQFLVNCTISAKLLSLKSNRMSVCVSTHVIDLINWTCYIVLCELITS